MLQVFWIAIHDDKDASKSDWHVAAFQQLFAFKIGAVIRIHNNIYKYA